MNMLPERLRTYRYSMKLTGALLIALIGSVGCGPPPPDTSTLSGLLQTSPRSMYTLQCKDRTTRHKKAAKEMKYVAPDLNVKVWKGTDPVAGSEIMSEKQFITAMMTQETKFSLVEARSGLGKSTLLNSIESQVCGKMPIFRLDLKSTVLPAMEVLRPGENAVYNEIARASGLDESERDLVLLDRNLKKDPWLLLLDAMDEVSHGQRMRVGAQVKEFVAKYPGKGTIVLFTRPPVFSSYFGIGVPDGRLEIKPLGCQRSEERIRAQVGAGANNAQFHLFASHFGLDRKVARIDECRYVHMASYRDSKVVIKVAEAERFDTTSEEALSLAHSNRAALYQHYFRAKLSEVRGHLLLPQGELLHFADLIVDEKEPEAGIRAIGFTNQECVNALEQAMGDRSSNVCRVLFESPMFKRMGETFQWTFSNQSVTDYFLARWIDSQLLTQGEANCGRVGALKGLFEASEAVSFLVGMDNGQRCLPEIVDALCKGGAAVPDTIDLLDQGLRIGNRRKRAVESIHAEADPKCAAIIKQSLLETIPKDSQTL